MRFVFFIFPVALAVRLDPLELMPPGVTSGLVAKSSDTQPYTLDLHAPEESVAAVSSQIDSIFKIERANEKNMEHMDIAEKQRLLNDEISKVRQLVQHSRHSFLRRAADYYINLHAPSESKSDIDAAAGNVLKSVAARASSDASADAALKAQLLALEMGKIKSIAGGR